MNRISKPTDLFIPAFSFQGLTLPVVVDLEDTGGFLQLVEGDNPLKPATPSVQLNKGVMLAIIPPENAALIRPHLREFEKQALKAIGKGMVEIPPS